MNVDVFISMPEYREPGRAFKFRQECQRAVFEWWLQLQKTEPGLFVKIRPQYPSNGMFQFQRDRRLEAEQNASTDLYIVADDDCVPDRWSTIVECLELAQNASAASQFPVLSLWPSNSTLHPWTPEGYEVYRDKDFEEHVSVGGIRICRKGVVTEPWPPMNDGVRGYDSIQAGHIRNLGYRVGYYKNFLMNHWGRNYSTTWRVNE